MKAEYDSSKDERGRFYRSDAEFSFPIYLEPDADAYLHELADERDEDVQEWRVYSIPSKDSGCITMPVSIATRSTRRSSTASKALAAGTTRTRR